jgi:hypothetical protein
VSEINDQIAWHNDQILLLQHQAVTGIMTHAEAREQIEELKNSRDRLYVRVRQ